MSVILKNVILPSVILSNVILPSAILSSVILPSVILPSVILPSVILPSDILSSVIVLNARAPLQNMMNKLLAKYLKPKLAQSHPKPHKH